MSKTSHRLLQPRGFTLLEVSITLLLLGLIMAIAVPSMNALTAASLRKGAGVVQGLMRDTYTRAALSGHSHRVVLDLEQRTYWVEVAEGGVVEGRVFDSQTGAGLPGRKSPSSISKRLPPKIVCTSAPAMKSRSSTFLAPTV